MWSGGSRTRRWANRRILLLAVAITAMAAWPAVPTRAGGHASEGAVYGGDDPLVVPLAASDCPVNYVCLWEHQDFVGTRVQYLSCCAWYNLADAGFNNTMSSWRNRKSVDAKVAENADGNGERLCLNDGGQNASVSAAWDNRASSIKIFSGSGAC